jgi:DNA-binding Lrp family transcriptional regulator
MLLDNLNQMLIKELENDARQPIEALARKLNVSRTAVRYRLDCLKSKGILTIACTFNFQLEGYLVAIGMNVSPGTVDTVASYLEPFPDVKVISLTQSRFDILVWAYFWDKAGFAHFLSQKLPEMPDVTTIEVMHAYQWIRNPFSEPSVEHPRRHLSELDLAIIRAMEQDPRQPIAKLARTVGCSRLVAKQSLDSLLDEGIISIVSYVDPTAQEYEIGVAILIRCKPDRVYDVANGLSVQHPASYGFFVTGRWQILIGARFQDSKHMYRFLSDELTGIPGIIEYEIVHLVKTAKHYVGRPNTL